MAGGRIFLHGCRKLSVETYKKNIRIGYNHISLHVAYTHELRPPLAVKSFERSLQRTNCVRLQTFLVVSTPSSQNNLIASLAVPAFITSGSEHNHVPFTDRPCQTSPHVTILVPPNARVVPSSLFLYVPFQRVVSLITYSNAPSTSAETMLISWRIIPTD